MNTTNLAIAVPVHIPSASSPRAQYFTRCLEHLKKACRHWPVYFFIDGGDIEHTRKLIADARFADTPRVIINSRRLDLGLNIINARRHCFDVCKHDLVFVCEDDVLVGPDLIVTLGHVLDWSKRHNWWPAIASSAGTLYHLSPYKVISGLSFWWNYLMPREAWDMMRPGIDEYASFLKSADYADRPDAAIRAWLTSRYNTPPTEGTYQDNLNRVIASKMGIQHWSLARNRAVHIGEHGTHFNPDAYINHGGPNASIQYFIDDTQLREFELLRLDAPVAATGPGPLPGEAPVYPTRP